MANGIKGYYPSDENRVTARRPALKPPRGGGKDILMSVPDSRLQSLAGQSLEMEATEHDDDGQPVTRKIRHDITYDDIHHEMKWRNLI